VVSEAAQRLAIDKYVRRTVHC